MIEKDKNKNIACAEEKITLLRIREKGLEKISRHDIIYNYSQKDKHKLCCDKIVKFIKENFVLTDTELNSISNLEYNKFEIDTEVLKLYSEIELEGSLLTKNPNLCKEWNYKKNNNLSPDKLKPNSELIVWWKCNKCDNDWQATIHDRHRGGKKCLKCKSIGKSRLEIIKEWHSLKNGNLTPYELTKGSSKVVWWKCKKGHEWQSSVHLRNKGSGCPYCSSHILSKENCLLSINPKLSKSWHPTLNKKSPSEVFPNSRTERAWWQCEKNDKHIWEAKIKTRHEDNQGCPYCDGKKVLEDNSFFKHCPNLSNQWHSSKNIDLTPKQVTKSSGKRVWWECKKCEHEWEANINNRVRTSGKCPNCKKK